MVNIVYIDNMVNIGQPWSMMADMVDEDGRLDNYRGLWIRWLMGYLC
jgi:hypothetical protein